MTAILDQFPFPWHRQEARELHITLSQIYPTPKAAVWAAAATGIDTGMINPDQAPFFVWREVLEEAAGAALVRTLTAFVAQQNSRNPKTPFLNALLSETAAPVPGEYQPRDEDGAPQFVLATDEISEQEALLFHDDLTLEFGRIPWLVDVLGRLGQIGAAVCKLHTSSPGSRQEGTGFRISEDRLLTNWHVLIFGAATSVNAEFGFEDDGRGGGLASRSIACDAATIEGNAALDWGVIKVAAPMPDSVGTISLSGAAVPVIDEPAFIIQHPGGGRKRVGYVRNQVTRVTDTVLQYLTDTQSGSSGSPVLNADGRLIGLHHAGGRAQEVAGKPPLSKNEGIRIPPIAEALTQLGRAFA
jgi:S1-C subfamily serine protease